MWKVEAFAEIPGHEARTLAAGWQTLCTVHHVATAERQAMLHRQDTGALTRLRFVPGLTIINRHGEIGRSPTQAAP